MNHVSIAIIRKKIPGTETFDYLVMERSGQNKFYEAIDMAIGSTFKFSQFKRSIIEHFKLPQEVELNGEKKPVDFEVPPTFFKSSQHDPIATAYTYDLSQHQIDAVNLGINSGAHPFVNVRWISEADLKNCKPWKQEQSFLFEREGLFRPPAFSNETRANLRKIVEAKRNGKLVIFAGAGVSIDSGVPGWGDLISELKKDLSTEEDNFKTVAELYYQARGHKEYHERINQILKHGETTYNPVHRKITELKPVHIITTNYDIHFEQVFENHALPYSVIRQDSDLPYSKGNSLYVKMHGDFDLRNIVLRQSDYDGYKDAFPLIQSFIREIFASKLVLFVGFSFTDSNLAFILDSVREILQTNIQPPYLFTSAPTSGEAEKHKLFLQSHDIRALYYEGALADYFSQVKSLEDQNSIDVLSPKGQEAYELLKVVQEFDIISDSLETQDMERQFTSSIGRFGELGAIPHDTLIAMTPFKLKQYSQHGSKARVSYFDPQQLETLNEEFLSFLDKLKSEKGKIEFLTYTDTSLPSEQRKLHKTFKLLFASGIKYISRKDDIVSTRIELVPKDKGNDTEQCQCARCLYDRMQIKDLLSALHAISAKAICIRELHDEGLFESYGFMKTGQLVKAFYTLEELRRSSLKSGRFITYVLATYNQFLLRPMFYHSYESRYNQKEMDIIAEKLEQIDTLAVIHELPIPSDIQKCLRSIVDNSIFNKTQPKIEEDFEQILETYRKYEGGGYSSSGPYYYRSLHLNFFSVWSFYHQNLLFTDENYSFSRAALIYLEGMIASYSTSGKYEQRLQKFPHFFSHILVQYGYASEIDALFKRYSVAYMPQEEDVQRIVQEFEMFLESGYDRSTFLGEKISKNITYHATAQSASFFQRRMLRTFNNFLLLTPHLELSDGQLNGIIDKMIPFLEHSEIFGGSGSLKYFAAFFKHHVVRIQEAHIQKIAHFVLSEHIWPADLISPFCNALISTKKVKEIFDEDILQRLIRRVEQKKEWTMEFRNTIPFFSLLKRSQQEKLDKIVDGNYRQHPNKQRDIFVKAYTWKMWNPLTKKEMCEEHLEYIASQGDPSDYTITEGGNVEMESFSLWNDIIFATHMIYSYDLFEMPIVCKIQDKVQTAMFRWILKPESFDYTQFEISWILIFKDPEFVVRLKKIVPLCEAINKGLGIKYNEKVARLFYAEYKSV